MAIPGGQQSQPARFDFGFRQIAHVIVYHPFPDGLRLKEARLPLGDCYEAPAYYRVSPAVSSYDSPDLDALTCSSRAGRCYRIVPT